MRVLVPAGLTLALTLLGSCQSLSHEEVGPNLDRAEAAVQAGSYQVALVLLERVHAVDALEPEARSRSERLIDQAARGRFAELADADPEVLEDLYKSELPERVRAEAGVFAAERYLAQGSRILAYRQIKVVDQELPDHSQRVRAGAVVAQAGLSLIRDEDRYLLLFHYRPRGVQALEYLVVHYPLESHGAEALYALSEAYEEDGDLDQAIQRSEELLLYHPESSYAAAANARLPYLRLCRLGRDDYDRGEILRAEAELGAWLTRYPGHELGPWVQEVLAECRRRLVRSDLGLARFYQRTRSPEGQRLHAERARALALEANLTGEAQQAERLLEGLSTPARATGSSR
jgi:tetratricopeptide (TPR) repeat protein